MDYACIAKWIGRLLGRVQERDTTTTHLRNVRGLQWHFRREVLDATPFFSSLQVMVFLLRRPSSTTCLIWKLPSHTVSMREQVSDSPQLNMYLQQADA